MPELPSGAIVCGVALNGLLRRHLRHHAGHHPRRALLHTGSEGVRVLHGGEALVPAGAELPPSLGRRHPGVRHVPALRPHMDPAAGGRVQPNRQPVRVSRGQGARLDVEEPRRRVRHPVAPGRQPPLGRGHGRTAPSARGAHHLARLHGPGEALLLPRPERLGPGPAAAEDAAPQPLPGQLHRGAAVQRAGGHEPAGAAALCAECGRPDGERGAAEAAADHAGLRSAGEGLGRLLP